MPISNLSNGLRTGVCTSTNRPTTPYEGQVIYETDTDLSYVWGGTAWQQVSGGTAVGNSGLVYVNSTTFTALSSVSVDSLFSTTYDNYRVELQFLQNTTGSGQTMIRLRTGGADVQTDYGYRSGGNFRTQTTNFFQGYANGNDLIQTFIFLGATQSATRGYASFDIFSPNLAQQTNIMGQYMGTADPSGNSFIHLNFGGWQNSTTQMQLWLPVWSWCLQPP